MPTTSTPDQAAVLVLLDTRETAALLHCSPKTLEVDRCRRRWRVPYLYVGSAIRYDRAAVLRWLADRNPSALLEG